MLRNTILFSLGALILLVTPLLADNTPSDRIIGTWLVEEKTGKIKIYRCGKKYCGKTVWIKPTKENPDPSKLLDVHNPNPKKRGQKLLGKTILWGLTYDGDDERWEDGSIYDTRHGKVYRCQVSLKDTNTLHLRGFLGIALIGQTTKWKRIGH